MSTRTTSDYTSIISSAPGSLCLPFACPSLVSFRSSIPLIQADRSSAMPLCHRDGHPCMRPPRPFPWQGSRPFAHPTAHRPRHAEHRRQSAHGRLCTWLRLRAGDAAAHIFWSDSASARMEDSGCNRKERLIASIGFSAAVNLSIPSIPSTYLQTLKIVWWR